LIILDGVLWDR